MDIVSKTVLCGKCLHPTPCQCRPRWENDPAIPENVKDFIRAYAVMTKGA